MLRLHQALLVVAACTGGGLAACTFCPDLALHAIAFDVPVEISSTTTIVVDVRRAASSTVVHEDVALSTLYELPAGAYDMLFLVPGIPPEPGRVIGELEAVCTLGRLTGCEAEDHTADQPRIAFQAEGGSLSVTLLHNGPCP